MLLLSKPVCFSGGLKADHKDGALSSYHIVNVLALMCFTKFLHHGLYVSLPRKGIASSHCKVWTSVAWDPCRLPGHSRTATVHSVFLGCHPEIAPYEEALAYISETLCPGPSVAAPPFSSGLFCKVECHAVKLNILCHLYFILCADLRLNRRTN